MKWKELKVGDRVRIMGNSSFGISPTVKVGTVIYVPDQYGWTKVKNSEGDWMFHRCQLRKIVKKSRRRLWANFYIDGTVHSVFGSEEAAKLSHNNYSADYAIEFIEVRKRK